MHSRTLKLAVALACFAFSAQTLADCAADATPAQTRAAYNKGLQLEREGQSSAAFKAFLDAQEYTCEANPVEADAARRAAAIGLQLGAAAEKKGEHEKAFELYDAAGHYVAADRALMALVRSNPDSVQVYTKARTTLEHRALPAFQSNNAVRLAATGVYRYDPKLLSEVLGMPERGAERAFAKEASAFNEQYLKEFVQLTQSTPDNPADFEAMQEAQARHQAFAQKWRQDPLKTSLDALRLAQSWASASNDAALSARIETGYKQVLAQRVATLRNQYSGAPRLLESAIEYQVAMNLEHSAAQKGIAAIRTQAEKLGDEASARQRFGLAAEYYSAADKDEKAQAARDQQQQLAMSAMQPSIDEMQRQAAEIQRQFSDPEKVKAMQAEAQALQRRMQEDQASRTKSNAQRADELEAELGM